MIILNKYSKNTIKTFLNFENYIVNSFDYDLSNGLVKKVAALEAADSTQDGTIADQGERITALENKVNNADTSLPA